VVQRLAQGTAPSELVALRLEVPPEEGAELERRAIHRRLVRIRNELRFLEVHLSDHPMAVLLPQASRLFCVTAAEADRLSGRRVRFAGTVAAMRRVPAGAGVVQFLPLAAWSGADPEQPRALRLLPVEPSHSLLAILQVECERWTHTMWIDSSSRLMAVTRECDLGQLRAREE
jgi:hypothetical protein